MKVQEILEFLNQKYPLSSACDFDNVGLLIGNPEAEITSALVCLDCDTEAIQKAISLDCRLIITHHPVIFEPLKAVTFDSLAYKLIRADISVISMHTNLDMGDGGVNDCLARAIGLEGIAPFTAADGFTLKQGFVPSLSAEALAERIKEALGGRVKFVDGGREITKLLVCSGSGGDFIADAIDGGFDALVTSDIKHHIFLTAKENSISLFDAGHFETEDICIEPLKKLLEERFKDVSFFTHHPDYLKYK